MNTNLRDKKEKIYKQLRDLENGDYQDREFAFDWIGYLGNEFISDSLERRLSVIEEKIKEYLSQKSKTK